jgi:hypothetical protein
MGRAQRRVAGLTCQKRLGRVPIVPLKIVQFLALTLTALALVPSGAHLFALPNKINLVAEQYFIVQNIYRGWSLFGVVLIGALIDQQLDDDPGQLGAIAPGLGVFACRQCGRDLRGIVLGRPIRADDAGTNAERELNEGQVVGGEL